MESNFYLVIILLPYFLSPLPAMLLLVAPTAAAGINFVAAVEFICLAVAGTFVAAEVVVPLDMHCLPAVGAATAIVVDVVAIVAVSVADVFACAVAVGFATLSSLSSAAPSMPLV